MARTVRNAKINTRSARTKLPVRREPHWTVIAEGRAVGYRRGVKGGTWIARWRSPEGKQQYQALGPADDALDPDGVTVLSYGQAQANARQWFEARGMTTFGGVATARNYTVEDAARDYLEWFRAHRKSVRETEYAINAFVSPRLGSAIVSELTTVRLREWHKKVSESPGRLRTRHGRTQQFRESPVDPEQKRKRRATANRILTVAKAILNHAWREGKVQSDDAWRRVKPFREADAARLRYISRDECTRLVNACDPNFRPLVQAALYTGCRYGELTRLASADFNPDAGAILVREAKSGKPRHVWLSDDGTAFFEAMTAGRPGDAPIFVKQSGATWGRSHQVRPIEEACRRAKIEPPASFHVLRHTYASHLVMGGAPLAVAARNLGHSDTRMVERHYAHLAPSYVAEAIRSVAPAIAPVDVNNVIVVRGHVVAKHRP